MKITIRIETWPHSFDAEDEIENALMDEGLRRDLEHVIEREIEGIMQWKDLAVRAHILD